jgi:hypothetical protein
MKRCHVSEGCVKRCVLKCRTRQKKAVKAKGLISRAIFMNMKQCVGIKSTVYPADIISHPDHSMRVS